MTATTSKGATFGASLDSLVGEENTGPVSGQLGDGFNQLNNEGIEPCGAACAKADCRDLTPKTPEEE